MYGSMTHLPETSVPRHQLSAAVYYRHMNAHKYTDSIDVQCIPLKVNDWQTPTDILAPESKSDVQGIRD